MTPYNLLPLTNMQWLAAIDLTASDVTYFDKNNGELVLVLSEKIMSLEPWEPIATDQILPIYKAYLKGIENRRTIMLPKLTSVTWIMVARMAVDDSVFLSHYDESTKNHDGISAPILVNDVFYWACSDAESTSWDEIPMLYKLWCEHPLNLIRFVAEKRQQAPQQPFLNWMEEQGYPIDWATPFIEQGHKA